jgi:hypothetical protein
MVVKIQVEVFLVVALCNVVVGYKHFGEPCCPEDGRQPGPLKHWCPTATLHSVTTQTLT